MYDTSLSIRVKYEGLPGNKTDWITVVPVGTPELAAGWAVYKPIRERSDLHVGRSADLSDEAGQVRRS